jgi:hypothetical protein
VLEGYWLIAPDRRENRGFDKVLPRPWATVRRWIGKKMRGRWVRAYTRLQVVKKTPKRDDEPEKLTLARTRAVRRLTERFPAEERLVLPTEFGNVMRAAETHPRERYGLDGVAIWPRVAALLTEAERAELEDRDTDLAFWVNGLVLVPLTGALLFAERLWHTPGGIWETIGVELAVVVAVVALTSFMYRQAILAGMRWGDPVRAAFDLHRFEVYEKLGVKRPFTRADDVKVGRAVGRMIAFAEAIPDSCRADPDPDPPPSPLDRLLARLGRRD